MKNCSATSAPAFAGRELLLASESPSIKDPQHVTYYMYYMIEDLVKALDGEIIVRWNNRTDVKAS
jgi:hypothetical protein